MACLVLIEGDHVWLWLHNLLMGLFGTCAILWPVLLLYISIVTAFERRNGRMRVKIGIMVGIIILVCAAFYIFGESAQESAPFFQTLGSLYGKGIEPLRRGPCGAASLESRWCSCWGRLAHAS